MQDKTKQIRNSQDSHKTLSAERERLSKEIDDLRYRRTRLEKGRPSLAEPIGLILAIVAIVLAIIFYILETS
jgi:uncharacterized protein YlxW (UPF0749 family)